MPFTFSHPVIVLPLAYLPKKWVSLTGLVVGSMIPDFEYFLRMTPASHYSHTLDGLFWFDLPLGLAVCWIFHQLVKPVLLDNTPLSIQARTSALRDLNWQLFFKNNWLIVCLSILIGAASHLFWDGFTHSYGYFVEKIPFLTTKLSIAGRSVGIYKFLQHGSTLVGGLVILFAIFRLPIDPSVKSTARLDYWLKACLIAVAVVALRLICGLSFREYGSVIVSGISGFLLALMILPFFYKK